MKTAPSNRIVTAGLHSPSAEGELPREPFVLKNYEAGLARHVVMATIELAANPLADAGLRQSALALANEHLNAGCSVSVLLLGRNGQGSRWLGSR